VGEPRARVLDGSTRPGSIIAPLEWNSDGRVLVYEQTKDGDYNLLAFDIAAGKYEPLVATDASEQAATISPSRSWLAYVSDQSGRYEVYVSRLGNATELAPRVLPERVSIEGGTEPVWSQNSTELFFRKGNSLYSVEIPISRDGQIGRPTELFSGSYVPGVVASRPNYDVTAEGDFIMVEDSLGLTSGRLDVYLNLIPHLEELLSPSRR
jgi:Tol biopolymer transport system component